MKISQAENCIRRRLKMKSSSQFLTDPSLRPATAVVNLIGKQAEIYMSVIGTNAKSHKNYCQHFGHWMTNGAGKFSPFPKMSFYPYRKQYALLRSTGVRVGGAECMVPPTPSLGGAVLAPCSAAYESHTHTPRTHN